MEEITGTAPNYWLEGSFASDLTNCKIALTIEKHPPGLRPTRFWGRQVKKVLKVPALSVEKASSPEEDPLIVDLKGVPEMAPEPSQPVNPDMPEAE